MKREFVKIGDLAIYVNGYAFKPSDWSTSGRPIIRIQDLTGNDYETHYFEGDLDERYKVRKGDLLISWSASIGVYEWKQEEAWLNQHIFKVVFDKGTAVEKKYFQYAVGNALNKVSGLVHGSTMKHLTKSAFDSIQVPIYSPDIQREIVQKLEMVQHGIDILILETKKLDTLVKSRFIEMFGDPVTNPMGWEEHNLDEYITFLTSGSRGWSKYFSDDGEIFITIKNVKNNRITLENVQYVTPPNNAEAQRTKVREGDLLISITADLGRTGVVSKDIEEQGAYINQHLTCIRLKQDKVNPGYVSYFMESNAGKRQFEAKNQAAVKAGLNFDAIKSLKLLVPPLEFQNEYMSFVEQVDKSKLAIRKLLEKQELLRAALMQEYFG